MHNIIWEKNAKKDLALIIEYIAGSSTTYASIFLCKVSDHLDSIMKFNFIGKEVPELKDESIRELPIWSYRLIYRIKKDKIIIMGILHSKRNFDFSQFENS